MADSDSISKRGLGIGMPSSWGKLFIFRRRPHLLRMPTPLTQPAQGALPEAKTLYNTQLEQAGFISESLLKDKGLTLTPELQTDLAALDEHLLADFWQQDYEALYYQNLYYLYQWIFILGALLTTVAAAVGVYIFESNPDVGLLGVKATDALQILTAILSGLVTAVSVLSAAQSPQDRWFKARTKSESLRSLYFLYLTRRDPFDKRSHTERVRQLHSNVLDILKPPGK